MEYVIAYDITEDNVRNDVGQFLLAKGLMRIQKSVYQGNLSKSELKEIKARIKEMIANATGTVNFFSQCKNCINRQDQLVSLSEQPDEAPEPISKQNDAPEEPLELPSRDLEYIFPTSLNSFLIKHPFEPTLTSLSPRPKIKRRQNNTTTTILYLKTLVIINENTG